MEPKAIKAGVVLSRRDSVSGKFEYNGELYSDLRVSKKRGAFIKDIEVSRFSGVVGDLKKQTKIIDPEQVLVVHSMEGAI